MRLFIAINLPDQIRREIWDSAALLRERRYPIRWVKPEGMHITLKFLGEVSGHREDSVVNALETASAGVHPFTLSLEGFGAFPDTRRARVVWLGCEPSLALEQLQRQIEDSTSSLGFPRETRVFHPHVTLGRLRRGAEKSRLGGLAGVLDRLHYVRDLSVDSIELMQSELSPAGADYTVRESFELTP